MPAPRLSLYPDKLEYNTGRSYKKPGTGKVNGTKPVVVPSVTSILKLADKSGLAQWAANLTFEYCNENWFMLGSRSDEDAKRASVYQWKKVRDERAEVGTGVHEAIESLHTGSPYPFLNEEQERIMEQFDSFAFAHKIQPDYTELTVWEDGRYAGTLDGLWYIDGELWLIDVKTSRRTWPEHFQQLSALAFAEHAWVQAEEGRPHESSDGIVTYWEQIENPALSATRYGLLHLTETESNLVEAPLEELKLHNRVFNIYTDLWYAKEKLRIWEKSRTI